MSADQSPPADVLRVITVSQPWASLIAIGAKRVETRDWAAKHRGRLAIHAAKGLPRGWTLDDAVALCRSEPVRSALIGAGLASWNALPKGVIVAVTTLDDVERVGDDGQVADGGALAQRFAVAPDERAFGNFGARRYGFLLGDVVALPEPVRATGALSVWRAPSGVAEAVEDALAGVGSR